VGMVVLLNCYPTLPSWEQTAERFADTAAEPSPPPTL
jgi:hypothetical protein